MKMQEIHVHNVENKDVEFFKFLISKLGYEYSVINIVQDSQTSQPIKTILNTSKKMYTAHVKRLRSNK